MFEDEEWVLPNPGREKEEEEAKKRRNPFRAIHHLLFDEEELQEQLNQNPTLQEELQPLYAEYLGGLLRETGIHPADLGDIITDLASLTSPDTQTQHETQMFIQKAYRNPQTPDTITTLHKIYKLLNEHPATVESINLAVKDVFKEKATEIILKKAEENDAIIIPIGDTEEIHIDRNRIYKANERTRRQTHRDRMELIEEPPRLSEVIHAAPILLQSNEHPILETRTEKVLIKLPETPRARNRKEWIGPGDLQELHNELDRKGYIIDHRHSKKALNAAINHLREHGPSIQTREVHEPGYYLIDGRVTRQNYTAGHTLPSETAAALELLEELREHYPGSEDILATVLKWGLLAPWNHILKKKGEDYLPWLLLYGDAQTGKTSLARISLTLYKPPHDPTIITEIGGSGFNTPYRIGEILSQTSLPVLIDEAREPLERSSTREIIKTSIQTDIARAKQRNDEYTRIPAYRAAILTTNYPPPNDTAIQRRILGINFTREHRKTQEKIREFHDQYGVDSPRRTRINLLEKLGATAEQLILTDPNIILEPRPWQEIADNLLTKIYEDAHTPQPEWTQKWAENATITETETDILEEIRNHIRETITQKIQRTTIQDEEGNLTTGTEKWQIERDELITTILRAGACPGLEYYPTTRGRYVLISTALITRLKKQGIPVTSLKALSQLIGWPDPYPIRVKRPGGGYTTLRRIKISLKEFLDFIHPEFIDDTHPESIDNDD